MDDLTLFLYLNGELSKEECQKVETWKLENQHEFNKIKRIWETTNQDNNKETPDLEKAWNNINPEKQSGKVFHFKSLMKYAAMLIVFLGISFITYKSLNKSTSDEWIEYASSYAETKEVELPDGSVVSLNKNSKLLFNMAEHVQTREVILEGEAFFDVKRNTSKPFIITAGKTETQVLGTSFNIKATKKQSKVVLTVVSGKVTFSEQQKPDNYVVLTAGDESIFYSEGKNLTVNKATNNNYLAWKTKTLLFKNSSMANVCKELSTYYETSITINQPGIANKTLSARYKNKSLQEVLQILELTLGIKSRQTTTGIELYSN